MNNIRIQERAESAFLLKLEYVPERFLLAVCFSTIADLLFGSDLEASSWLPSSASWAKEGDIRTPTRKISRFFLEEHPASRLLMSDIATWNEE
jgi:hypothetical protein